MDVFGHLGVGEKFQLGGGATNHNHFYGKWAICQKF